MMRQGDELVAVGDFSLWTRPTSFSKREVVTRLEIRKGTRATVIQITREDSSIDSRSMIAHLQTPLGECVLYFYGEIDGQYFRPVEPLILLAECAEEPPI